MCGPDCELCMAVDAMDEDDALAANGFSNGACGGCGAVGDWLAVGARTRVCDDCLREAEA